MKGPTFQLLAGAAVAALGLWLTFRGTDLALVGDALTRAHPEPIVVALLLIAGSVTAGAQRWRAIVFPGLRGGQRLPLFLAAVITGQMLNLLLPMRLGELGRAYWISRTDHQPLGRILATIVIERLADVLLLCASISLLLLQVSLPAWARASGRVALSTGVALLACAAALGMWGSAVVRALEKPLAILPSRVQRFLVGQSEMVLAELATLGQWRSSVRIWLLSALIVVLAAATNYALFKAFDLPLPPLVALLLFVTLQIGGTSVSTPGNLGVFHYLVVVVLGAFGVDRTTAVAYAVVLHLVAVGPKIIAGAAILAATRHRFLGPDVWNEWKAARSFGRV